MKQATMRLHCQKTIHVNIFCLSKTENVNMWKMWKLVITCWNLWKLVKTCENLWKLVKTRENSLKLTKMHSVTDGRTDKVTYRVACTRLKNESLRGYGIRLALFVRTRTSRPSNNDNINIAAGWWGEWGSLPSSRLWENCWDSNSYFKQVKINFKLQWSWGFLGL